MSASNGYILVILFVLLCVWEVHSQDVSQPRGCFSLVQYRHEEKWNDPTSICRTCMCYDGEITCTEKQCLKDEELPCKNPVKSHATDCCKSCPNKGKKRTKKDKIKRICVRDIRTDHRRKHRLRKQRLRTNPSRERRKRRRRGRRRERRRRGRNRRRGRSTRGNNKLEVSSYLPPLLEHYPERQNHTVPAFYHQMCVPRKAYYLIYKHIEFKEMFLAFDNARTNLVEVWKWKLGKKACESVDDKLERCQNGSGRIHLKEHNKYVYPVEQFRRQVTKPMLFAAASKRELDKFKARLSKNMDICAQKNKCRVTMIPRAFFNLNMRQSKKRKEQVPQGMDLHKVKYNCTMCQDD